MGNVGRMTAFLQAAAKDQSFSLHAKLLQPKTKQTFYLDHIYHVQVMFVF